LQKAAPSRVTETVTAPRRVSVLGATGSVGRSTLELIGLADKPHTVVAVTANRNAKRLAELAVAHGAETAVLADPAHYRELRDYLSGTGIEAAAGSEALVEAASRPADWVMAAIMGAAGLRPTWAAVQQGTRVALANKECLVSAGSLFMQAIGERGTTLLPVDSEHSAAFQTLDGSRPENIEQIILTASGGPFRTWDMNQLRSATPEQALNHPNWSMGDKITIDSATLMNKGLELIEAYHLFPVEPHQLDVVVHPQSMVHCLVQYRDGSALAQLSSPDMRTPIAYSLSWPERMPTSVERLNLAQISRLDFEPPDHDRFPALGLARQALEQGTAACTVLNGANEVAVEAFLARNIGFLEIARLVARALQGAEQAGLLVEPGDIDEILVLDAAARQLARGLLNEYGHSST